eukprot:CAMPEP_0194379914 /NCGR_PEP_ID=MMETSP0174-20130528/41378_1 /TAXON_ID=216777 /ORGANISM="Proboscia alata, Strain PI-D3" /LENGTH=42 /DNA_ID= /DNA_START= /DNA_END= /DNA_ORIENTATION=
MAPNANGDTAIESMPPSIASPTPVPTAQVTPSVMSETLTSII